MSEITESILASVKRLVGIPEDDTTFDPEVIIHINSALADLVQMGVGNQQNGFAIEDETATWTDFLGDNVNKQNQAKLFVFAKVKIGFDSSNMSSSTKDSYEKLANECAYRLYTENDVK